MKKINPSDYTKGGIRYRCQSLQAGPRGLVVERKIVVGVPLVRFPAGALFRPRFVFGAKISLLFVFQQKVLSILGSTPNDQRLM